MNSRQSETIADSAPVACRLSLDTDSNRCGSQPVEYIADSDRLQLSKPGDFVVVLRPQKNKPNLPARRLARANKYAARACHLDCITYWEVKP